MKRPATSAAQSSHKRAAISKPAFGEPAFLSDALSLAREWDVRQHSNAIAAISEAPYPSSAKEAVSLSAVDDALKIMEQWPEFKCTPLVSLSWLARSCGVKSVFAKDESGRCGLTSFKALGGGLVVDDVVKKALAEGKLASEVIVATASAGNHGMGVAWGAKRTGCQAVIYLGERVSESIAQKMRNLGARVSRVKGSYEDSLAAAKRDSESNGWTLVQDVSWDGYNLIPARIHAGYAVVAAEILKQFADMRDGPPTHILVNAGVGGFACAVCGFLWQQLGAARPRFVCVEPTAADNVQHASRTGSLVQPASSESTVQTGLDCREVSPLAWHVLHTGVNDYMAVPDAAIGPCMKLLAQNLQPIVAGESGVAGIAVLLAAATRPELKKLLHLGPESRVAVIVCEVCVSGENHGCKTAKRRLVFVTGAARGLGVGICRQILDQDGTSEVVVTARRFDDAERVCSELGERATPLQCDVSSESSCREAAEKVLHLRQGRALSLVNNAGVAFDTWHPTPWPARTARDTLDVNLFGVKRITEALMPQLNDADAEGRIVMVSTGGAWKHINYMSAERRAVLLSDALSWQDLEELCEQFIKEYETAASSQSADASSHMPYLSASGFWLSSYGFSKACLNAYCRILARSYPSVLSVCYSPGMVKTDMPNPLFEGESKSPYEAGDAGAWLACTAEAETGCFYSSDRSKFVRKRKD